MYSFPRTSSRFTGGSGLGAGTTATAVLLSGGIAGLGGDASAFSVFEGATGGFAEVSTTLAAGFLLVSATGSFFTSALPSGLGVSALPVTILTILSFSTTAKP